MVMSLSQFSKYLLIVFNFFLDMTIHELVTDIFSYRVNAMTMYGLNASEILIESQTSLGVPVI